MTHKDVLKMYEHYFPNHAGERISIWFPNGKNSIRVREVNGQEFVFTFNSHKDWRFETLTAFLSSMPIKKG